MLDVFIDRADIAGLLLFPDLHAARIDDFASIRLGGAEQPGDEVLEPLGLAFANGVHHIVIVPHEDIKALVDAGRVGELLVSVSRGERGYGGIEGGRVTQSRVLVARCERAGHAAHCAAVHHGRTVDLLTVTFFLGTHLSGGVDLRPRDVAMHVDAAGHDDEARGIQRARWSDAGVAGRLNDLFAVDPDVLYLAVDAVCGVIDIAAGDEEEIRQGIISKCEWSGS